MTQLDPAALEQRIKTDERFFVELCLSVMDKSTGTRVPFKLNGSQHWYEERKSSYDIILKARKLGFSTRIIASDIWACAFKRDQHAVLLSHDMDATVKLLKERVLPIAKSSLYPLKYIERADGLEFPDTNSRYYIGTAGTRKFGRGSDITRYHLSEFAHWKDPELITGVEEACLTGATGRIETTANGTNFFYLLWRKSKRGAARYKPIFVGWNLDPTYSIPGARLEMLNEEEAKLVEAYGLTHAQLAWRRQKINGMSRPELFAQEYPISDEEAFLTSGRMVFDWASLVQHERECAEPRWRGYIRLNGDRYEFNTISNGHLGLWVTPQRGHKYVIGADIAEGLADGAFSAAFVLDANTGEQVAEWHGHCSPDIFGEVLANMGWYYNNALVVPESWPGPGAVTMQKLLDMHYQNLHQRPAKANRTKEQRWGWETTARTRPQMIHGLATAMRDFLLKVRSQQLIDEMRNIVYDDRNDIVVQPGSFSDRVMAAAIAWAVAKEVGSGLHSGLPKFKHLEKAVRQEGGAVSAPKWRGPIYGVRGQ